MRTRLAKRHASLRWRRRSHRLGAVCLGIATWVAIVLAGSSPVALRAAEVAAPDESTAAMHRDEPQRHDVSPSLWQMASLSGSAAPMSSDDLRALLATTDLWSGFGGPCSAKTPGSLDVSREPDTGRWVVEKTVGDRRCIATSVTEDATGSYAREEFIGPGVSSCDPTCAGDFVSEHNRVRTRVNDGLMPAPTGFQPIPAPPLAPLSWDSTIAGGSQAWSDLCVFQHSSGTGLGENLYASAGSPPTPADAVANWESESILYTYAAIGDPVNDLNQVGHYTQLVWANTSLVGCGITHCTTNTPFPGFPEWDFVVCRYSPPGNITGEFPYAAATTCSNNAACDDGNACTDDVCTDPGTPSSRCTHANNSATCSDGNPCTGPDVCAAPADCGAAENFDGVIAPALPAGWTTAVTGTGNAWTTTGSSFDSPPNSAFGFDGEAIADEVLVSPAIAIRSPSATLTFKNRWRFEDATACFDGGVLEIQIGAGAFSDIVAAGGSFTGGGYTGTVASAYGNPLGGRSAWCGDSAGYPSYLTTTVNLPAAAAGQTIQLRWRVGTDSSNGAAGQNVDSVVITDTCAAACTPGPAISAPAETQNLVVASDKATYSWAAAASATRYDVVRGSTSALPVGPGGGDEVCFDNLPGPSLVDATVPSPGAGFWYLSRGENDCANGTYGTQGLQGAPGAVRATTTCP